MEVCLEQRRHRTGPMRRQDDVRASHIGKYPFSDVFFVSNETKFLFVPPDVLRKCAFSALCTVVLACEPLGIVGLPYA